MIRPAPATELRPLEVRGYREIAAVLAPDAAVIMSGAGRESGPGDGGLGVDELIAVELGG